MQPDMIIQHWVNHTNLGCRCRLQKSIRERENGGVEAAQNQQLLDGLILRRGEEHK